MKLIFLDIDGVLNSKDTYTRQMQGLCPGFGTLTSKNQSPHILGIDPVNVAVLEEIVKLAKAKIVISSAWREMHPMAEIIAWLRGAGFTGDIIGKTPDNLHISDYPRGHEIHAWLRATPGRHSFIILDDRPDMDRVQRHLFLIDHDLGLLPADIPKVITFWEGLK